MHVRPLPGGWSELSTLLFTHTFTPCETSQRNRDVRGPDLLIQELEKDMKVEDAERAHAGKPPLPRYLDQQEKPLRP